MDGQAGNRRKLPPKKQRLSIPVVGVLLALVALCLLSLQVWQWISLKLVDVEPLKKSTLVENLPAEAVLIKNEIPVKAPITGKIEMLAADGERLRVGSPIARIVGPQKTVTVYSPRAGLLCTHLDGLEGVLIPKDANVLDIKMLEKIELSGTQKVAGGEKAQKGIPFCKLVDNLQPILIYLRVEEESIDNLEKRENYSLILQGERTSGRLMEFRSRSPWQLLLKVTQYPKEILHSRLIKAQIIMQELNGYTIPQDALVFEGNQTGIFVVEQQFVNWVPVQVKEHFSGTVILEENNISANTRYITNPVRVKKGARVEW